MGYHSSVKKKRILLFVQRLPMEYINTNWITILTAVPVPLFSLSSRSHRALYQSSVLYQSALCTGSHLLPDCTLHIPSSQPCHRRQLFTMGHYHQAHRNVQVCVQVIHVYCHSLVGLWLEVRLFWKWIPSSLNRQNYFCTPDEEHKCIHMTISLCRAQ